MLLAEMVFRRMRWMRAVIARVLHGYIDRNMGVRAPMLVPMLVPVLGPDNMMVRHRVGDGRIDAVGVVDQGQMQRHYEWLQHEAEADEDPEESLRRGALCFVLHRASVRIAAAVLWNGGLSLTEAAAASGELFRA